MRFLLAFVLLALVPGAARAQVAVGERLLAADSLEAAEAAFRAALGRAPVAARVGLARVAIAEERWRAAGDHADDALERDPDDLAAHLARAVAYRGLARHRTIVQRFHWKGAEEHFEAVLARDSSFANTLYAYALLRRYGEGWDDAFAFAHAALRLRPDLEDERLGVFRLYRHFTHAADEDAVRARLAADPTAFGAYFRAEALRRADRLREADAAFAALADTLAADAPLPRAAVLLARARVHFALDDDAAGQAFFERAVDAVDGRAASDALFEDFQYLFTEDEWRAYRRLAAPDALQTFWRAFWAKRDPMRARAVNVRLAEHYRRLDVAEREFAFYGYRTFFNDPDRLMALEQPETFVLNEGLNDRGLIYVRHGEPDDRITHVSANTEMNESWRYYGDPPMDVHFSFGTGGTGNNWRLTAIPPGYWTRSEWGGPYVRMSRARSQLELHAARHEFAEASRESTWRALTTDAHAWPEDVEPIDVPHLAAAFRAAGGATRVEVHYAPPVARLRALLPDTATSVAFEVGAALHDTAWTPAGTDRRTVTVALDAPPAPGLFRFVVAADTYHVALHGRTPAWPRLLGGYDEGIRAPDFAAPGLAMSDLLPALHVGPARGDAYDRGDLHVLPAPGAAFAVADPVFVYFEVYGLTREGGETDVELTYTLTPEGGRPRLFGLLGRDDRPVLTLRTTHAGTDADPAEYAELDVARVDPGAYTLTVAVTDRHTGATFRRTRALTLVE